MRYLINPMTSVRYKGKPASRARFHAAGFSRNPKKPTKRQLAARKKFAAMARARAAGARRIKRAQSLTGGRMARRKRSRAVTRRNPRRRRRHAVAVRRRRVYAANPRRRVRRHSAKRRRVGTRRYRRNPDVGSMVNQAKDLFVGAGVGLVGMAAGRTISNMIPFNATSPAQQPLFDFAKGAIVAVAIRVLGEKVVGRDYARIAAIGALLIPTKNLIVNYAPGASNFLGASDGVMAMPRFTNARRIAAYPGGVASYAGGEGMGAYSDSYPN